MSGSGSGSGSGGGSMEHSPHPPTPPLTAHAQVKANFLALAKSKHGRHLVQKHISTVKKEEVPGVHRPHSSLAFAIRHE